MQPVPEEPDASLSLVRQLIHAEWTRDLKCDTSHNHAIADVDASNFLRWKMPEVQLRILLKILPAAYQNREMTVKHWHFSTVRKKRVPTREACILQTFYESGLPTAKLRSHHIITILRRVSAQSSVPCQILNWSFISSSAVRHYSS